jgi:site-specific DNA-cytosine methylase
LNLIHPLIIRIEDELGESRYDKVPDYAAFPEVHSMPMRKNVRWRSCVSKSLERSEAQTYKTLLGARKNMKLTIGLDYVCTGHWTLAAQRAGLQVLWHWQPSIYGNTNLPDKMTQTILHANFPKIPFTLDTFREPSGVEIMAGSPPCVGLSQANPIASADHPANLNTILFHKSVNKICPIIYVMEIVPQIFTTGLPVLTKALDIVNRNYKVAYWLYDLSEYGSPSNRKRVYILGIRKPTNLNPKFILANLHKSKHVKPVVDVIGDLQQLYDRMLPDNRMLMSRFGLKHRLRVGPYSMLKKNWQNRVLRPDSTSPTITGTSYCNVLHWSHNIHEPKLNRFLGKLEISRLMGYPDTFDFNPTHRKMQAPVYSKLIASGVQIQFTAKLLKHIISGVF